MELWRGRDPKDPQKQRIAASKGLVHSGIWMPFWRFLGVLWDLFSECHGPINSSGLWVENDTAGRCPLRDDAVFANPLDQKGFLGNSACRGIATLFLVLRFLDFP